jgi:single-strand DNA-binding protein
MGSRAGAATASGEWANEVRLVGRVSGEVEARVLPSGDEVALLRLVVPRPARSRRGPGVDTLDLACWTARTRARAGGLGEGDVVEVAGSLRRRFYRTGGGAASRYEVEVASLRRRTKA